MHEDEYQGEGLVERYSEVMQGIDHTRLLNSGEVPHAWQVRADAYDVG